MTSVTRPLSLTLAALGGQGGGVLASWLTAVARLEGYLVQATSVPGVAQRTGATIYYLEFFPCSGLPADGRRPVMALMPNPGDVDIVVASEWIEAGRMIQRGLVTPDRTTLIASTHREYTISEKSDPLDGRADADAVLAEARRRARRLVAYDMASLAEQHGAIISAVILGAIAGAADLPFAVESYRQAIRQGGIAVATNLAAFDASFVQSQAGGDAALAGLAESPAQPAAADLPAALAKRIRDGFPAPARAILAHGVSRLLDYQDEAYAAEYLERVERVARVERPGESSVRLTIAVARGLALWMSFEDTIRVAELKVRPGRLAGIRRSAGARAGQVIEISEFLKPRVEEICGTLPAGLGRRLLASSAGRRCLAPFTGARRVRSTTITGFLLLRSIAALKRWRRGTLRYAEETDRIDAWLGGIARHAAADYELAVELAECQRLVKGYGDTYERGLAGYERIATAAAHVAGREEAAATVARLRHAATADDSGETLRRELAALGRS